MMTINVYKIYIIKIVQFTEMIIVYNVKKDINYMKIYVVINRQNFTINNYNIVNKYKIQQIFVNII